MAVISQIDQGGCQPYGARKSRFLSIDMARPRTGDASLAAAPDRRRMRWGSRVIHHARFCGAKKCLRESLCDHGSFVFVRVVGPSCSLWNQAAGICKAVLETRM